MSQAVAPVAAASAGGSASGEDDTTASGAAATAAVAVAAAADTATTTPTLPASPTYPASRPILSLNLTEVHNMIENQKWQELSAYLHVFVKESEHPELFVHSRRGELGELVHQKRYSDAIRFFEQYIAPLGHIRSKFTNNPHVESLVNDIGQCINNQRPVGQPENVGQLIEDYLRLHFAKLVGHDNQGNSKFWAFAFMMERIGKKVKYRCLACGKESLTGKISKSIENHLRKSCPKSTMYILDRLEELIAEMCDAKAKRLGNNVVHVDRIIATTSAGSSDRVQRDVLVSRDMNSLLQMRTQNAGESLELRMMKDKGTACDVVFTYRMDSRDPVCINLKDRLEGIFDNLSQQQTSANTIDIAQRENDGLFPTNELAGTVTATTNPPGTAATNTAENAAANIIGTDTIA